jgi:hypothetical protein
MKYVLNIRLANMSGTLRTIQLASTLPPGVLITYGASVATSHNLAFLAQKELIKSCDAPESKHMIIGRLWRKNVPASTSSPLGISSTEV